VCILTSDIVWINGPYMPGDWNDLSIFQDGLMHQLENGEWCEADNGYRGECPRWIKCPGHVISIPDRERMQMRVRLRHETFNERLKNFRCLDEKFRHSVTKHSSCFRAICVLTQLAIESGEEIFDAREYDDTLRDVDVRNNLGL
jgi:hypothetical protein